MMHTACDICKFKGLCNFERIFKILWLNHSANPYLHKITFAYDSLLHVAIVANFDVINWKSN